MTMASVRYFYENRHNPEIYEDEERDESEHIDNENSITT